MFLLDLIQLLVHSPTPAIHSPDSDRKCLFKFKSTTTAPQKNRRSDIFTTLSVFSRFLRISVMPIYFVPVQYINTLTVSIPATRRHCASVSGGSWFQDLFTHLAPSDDRWKPAFPIRTNKQNTDGEPQQQVTRRMIFGHRLMDGRPLIYGTCF